MKERWLINCIIVRLAICHRKPLANSEGIGKILASLQDEKDINRNLEAQFVKLHEWKCIVPFHHTPNKCLLEKTSSNHYEDGDAAVRLLTNTLFEGCFNLKSLFLISGLSFFMGYKGEYSVGQDTSLRTNKLWLSQFHSIRTKLSLAMQSNFCSVYGNYTRIMRSCEGQQPDWKH